MRASRFVLVAALVVAATLVLSAQPVRSQWIGRSAHPQGNRFFNQFGHHPMMRQAAFDPWRKHFGGGWPDPFAKRHVWHPQHEQATQQREQAAREQAAREQAAREQAAREQAAREQAAREQAAREQAAREQAAREQAAREQAAREEAARRERQARLEQAVRDREARLQQWQDAARDAERERQAALQRAQAPPVSRDETAEYDDRYELVVRPRRDMWNRPIPFRVQYGGGGTTVVVRELARGGFHEEYIIPKDVNPRSISTRTGPRGELVVTFPRTPRPEAPRDEDQSSMRAAAASPKEDQSGHRDNAATHGATRHAAPQPATPQEQQDSTSDRVRSHRSASEDAEARAERKRRREERYREWQHQQHLKRAQEEMRKEREAQRAERERQSQQHSGLSRVHGHAEDEMPGNAATTGRLRRREQTRTTVVEEFHDSHPGDRGDLQDHDDGGDDDWLRVEDVPIDDGEDVAEDGAASGYYMRGDFVEY